MFDVLKKVPVTPFHFCSALTEKFVNDSQVETVAREVAVEAMTQAMPVFDLLPATTLER